MPTKHVDTLPLSGLLIMSGLLFLRATPSLAQKPLNERERASFWASKGQNLMATTKYAEAYTAFQLARSLGALNMAAQMELAKKRNINSIQFRALIAEARQMAATDPTQSLRLLEYAQSVFPDSTSLLKAIGEVANRPDNWYYSLRADSIKASPKFTYLLADTDKCRLYLRQGNSLALIHTFSERPDLRVFSPDEHYLFIRNSIRQGSLYTLQGAKINLTRIINDTVVQVGFSPNTNPDYGSWLLTETPHARTHLNSIQLATKPDYKRVMTFNATLSQCRFSPSGRYFLTTSGVWQVSVNGLQGVKGVNYTSKDNRLYIDSIPAFSPGASSYGIPPRNFPNDRQLFTIQNWWMVGGDIRYGRATLSSYSLTERGDSLRYTGAWQVPLNYPRPFQQTLSNDGQYLSANDSLLFAGPAGWQIVLPVPKPQHLQLALKKSPTALSKPGATRFLPGSRHVLTLLSDTTNRTTVQVWRLDQHRRYLIHEFTEKEEMNNDIFSPDGRYVLAQHTTTDRLWRIESDTVVLVHTFKKSLRRPTMLDEEGYPKGEIYFSPDSKYLLTYSATLEEADSLWQIGDETPGHVRTLWSIHGFDNRLLENLTTFSPNGRFLLTTNSGIQPACLWNLDEQINLLPKHGLLPAQALFSPKGNYLLTNVAGLSWRVTDRTLHPFSHPYSFTPLANCQFSADDNWLIQSASELYTEEKKANETFLYKLTNDRFTLISHYATRGFLWALPAGNPVPKIESYQSGVFSPDGRQWLQSQSVNQREQRILYSPSQVFRLIANDTLQNSLESMQMPVGIIDRLTVTNTTPEESTGHWHSLPAALFSRDGRFLLTTEHSQLQFYSPGHEIQVNVPSAAVMPIGQQALPQDVSAQGDYWLTRMPPYYYSRTQLENNDEQPGADYAIPYTPDSIRIWRRAGDERISVWKQLAVVGGLYTGLNRHWQGNRRQSWFSTTGNYLLLPTTKPALTTFYTLTGDNLRPLLNLNAQLLAAAHIPAARQNGWDAGLLYTNTSKQTLLLRYGSGGTRTTSLGFGLLERPPRFWGKQAYWVRKLDESQQKLEILDLVSGSTLVQVSFGAILDFTVRPNGDAWVISPSGARLIRAPESTLRWLKQAPVAPLQPELHKTYLFL